MELEINTLLLISNYIHCLFTEFDLRDTDSSLFVEAQFYIFFMCEDIMRIQFFGYNFQFKVYICPLDQASEFNYTYIIDPY